MNEAFLALKRDLAADLVRIMSRRDLDEGDVAVLLGTDWARVSDLRRGRLDRFSIERLLLFHHRLSQRIEVRLVDERPTRPPQPEPRTYGVPSRRTLNRSRRLGDGHE